MFQIIIKIAYLMAIVLSAFTAGWLMVKADRNRLTGALAGCQLLIIIWCIPQLFSSLAVTKELKFLTYSISYIGISFIGPAWLTFAFLYSRKRLVRTAQVLLFGYGAVNYLLMLTNDIHHLFYSSFRVEQVTYGPVFYLHMVFTYCCVLSGMAVVLLAFRRDRVAPVHITVILLAAAVPLLFNMLYLTGIVRTAFDLTPPAFAFSSLFMLLAVFRYDFLDINTIAFKKIFDTISEGVIVYNKRDIITYCNQAAKDWFGVSQGVGMADLFARLTRSGFDLVQGELVVPAEPVLEMQENGAIMKLEVKQSVYGDKKGQSIVRALMFTDVGKYYQLLEQGEQLAVSNQRLAVEQERNRIAQEVHDTAGHTLTMINSLMKLSRIEYDKMRLSQEEMPATAQQAEDPVRDYLVQAQELAENGIRELRCSINNLRQAAAGSLISQRVHQLAHSVKEIAVDVEIQGEDTVQYAHLSAVVYECVREAITNCLKYAGASHMDIILKFADRALHLYLFDDGAGCDEIKESNGLKGIRERVEKAGGEVRFVSAAGEGFQIFIRLGLESRQESEK